MFLQMRIGTQLTSVMKEIMIFILTQFSNTNSQPLQSTSA